MSFFKANRRNRLSRRKSLSTTQTYYLEGGGRLELSTITAGQAKWTARWQTRIPGQRTIEAWTCLHIVLSEPAGRNSFGPPAARSTRRLSSPRQTEFDLVHVHHRSRRDSPVSDRCSLTLRSPRPVPLSSTAGFRADRLSTFRTTTIFGLLVVVRCTASSLCSTPLRTPARLPTAACLSA